MSHDQPTAIDIWDYLRARAKHDSPESLTFYDPHDDQVYSDVNLQVIGKHGWELVTVLSMVVVEGKPPVYEYFFKRNRARGYSAGFGQHRAN